MQNETTIPSFVSPVEQAQNLSSELKEELVLLRPTRDGERTITTEHGERSVRDVEALIVLGGSEYRNLGEVSIFWEVVKDQLPERNQWIAGRIVHGKKAYYLQVATIEEIADIQQALETHSANPIPVEHPPTEEELETPF